MQAALPAAAAVGQADLDAFLSILHDVTDITEVHLAHACVGAFLRCTFMPES